MIKKYSNSLISKINKKSDEGWFWPLNEMSYENARIPLALFKSWEALGNSEYFDYANSLTNFLDETVFEENYEGETFLNVVGNNASGLEGTWYKKGSIKPKYDEQPVDVGGMVELHSEAYKINGDLSHLEKAKISLDWFNGRNRLGKKMISSDGGVYDGLGKNDINKNQGAESLLAYMMANLEFNEVKNGI